MSNIPIPSQGQPIDYNYIYQIVDTLNALSTSVSTNYSQSKVMDRRDSTTETKRINELSIGAYYQQITADKSVNAKYEKSFTQSFNMTYAYPPVVTATPQVLEGTVGRDVSIVIEKVTEHDVTGFVAFNDPKSGKTSIAINIIAVGVPSNS